MYCGCIDILYVEEMRQDIAIYFLGANQSFQNVMFVTFTASFLLYCPIIPTRKH